MKKHVLFVDDEPNILDGLRRMLRGMRDEWSMAFASSGHDALRMMESESFDVVVSDMRMPEMDGCELLSAVRDRFPAIVRIILTGQCSREALLKVISVAHRQLSKPCDAALLKETITGVCALEKLLAKNSLRDLVSRLQTIPSLPSLYDEVIQEIEAPDPSLHKLGQIISRDMAMTARIIQVVNSSLFGVRSKVVNPAQAVILLGLQMTKLLVLATDVFGRFESRELEPFSIRSIWEHSVQATRIARSIAQAEHADAFTVECATLAGLLHNIGILILAENEPETYKEVLGQVQHQQITLCEAEALAFGTTHAELGAYLLGLWDFPDSVVDAVAWHHRPGECPGTQFQALTATHVAAHLSQEGGNVWQQPDQMPIDFSYLERLGLSDRMPIWRALVKSTRVCSSAE